MIEYEDKAKFLKDALSHSNGKKIQLIQNGEEISRLTARDANPLYARTKLLKEQIRSALLTQAELEKATEKNINKFIHTEGSVGHTQKVQEYKNIMTAIGADPNDISTERIRKGR